MVRKAFLGADGRYTAFAPNLVGGLGSLIEQLREEAGHTGCAFAGFVFPASIPEFYAKRAGISSFRALLPKLGKDFYYVCDEPSQTSAHRPFYPNGTYEGRRKDDLFRGHGVSSLEPLLRRCERGGDGHKLAFFLFWTLGSNQVGKAPIIGWRDVLGPALRNKGAVSFWPFDGPLHSQIVPGKVLVAET